LVFFPKAVEFIFFLILKHASLVHTKSNLLSLGLGFNTYVFGLVPRDAVLGLSLLRLDAYEV